MRGIKNLDAYHSIIIGWVFSGSLEISTTPATLLNVPVCRTSCPGEEYVQRTQHSLLPKLTFLHDPNRQRDVVRVRSRYRFHSQNFWIMCGLVSSNDRIQDEEKLRATSWRETRCEPPPYKLVANFWFWLFVFYTLPKKKKLRWRPDPAAPTFSSIHAYSNTAFTDSSSSKKVTLLTAEC